jgi:hypothetical protein
VVRLFKPHGSSNWGWPFIAGTFTNTGGKSIPKYIYDMQFTPNQIYYDMMGGYNKMLLISSWGIEQEMNPNHVGRYTINKNRIEIINGTQPYLPALQLPYRDKDEFVMPFDHYHYLKDAMHEVEVLFLIGWKGNEFAFNRLLKMHAGSLKKIVIVNPDADNVIQNLSAHFDLTPGQTRYTIEVVKTFKEFVTDKLDGYLAQ